MLNVLSRKNGFACSPGSILICMKISAKVKRLVSQRHKNTVYMVLFMTKSHLYNIRIDSQPALFLSGIQKGVSIETPEHI